MPRGKSTNVFLVCKEKVTKLITSKIRTAKGKSTKEITSKEEACGMQNYNMRLNKKTRTKEEKKKFCGKCNKHTPHATGSEIKHSSGK